MPRGIKSKKIECECLTCLKQGTYKAISSHVGKKHGKKMIQGETYRWLATHKKTTQKTKSLAERPPERHCVCLICNDDHVRGYSATYNHIVNSHKRKMKRGKTYEYTDKPTTGRKGPSGNHKPITPQASTFQLATQVIRVPAILTFTLVASSVKVEPTTE